MLLLRALAAVAGARLLVSVLPSSWVYRLSRAGRARRRISTPAARLEAAVCRAGSLLPGTSCLPAALALRSLLLAAGHPASLTFGVAGAERGLSAHAWVECEGLAADGARFAPLLARGATG